MRNKGFVGVGIRFSQPKFSDKIFLNIWLYKIEISRNQLP